MPTHCEIRILQSKSRFEMRCALSRDKTTTDNVKKVKLATHRNIFDNVVPKDNLIQGV
jgi:hypothetical protein